MTENCISPGGPIRKTVFDPGSKRFVVEYENRDSGLLHYVLINTEPFALGWSGQFSDPESMVALEGVIDESLIFTRYDDPEDPESTSVLAYDIQKQAVAWEHRMATILEIGSVVRIRLNQVVLNIRAENGDEAEWQEAPKNLLLTPNRYLEGTPHFETVAGFLRKKRDITPVRVIDYLQTDQSIFISYYLYQEDQFDLFLSLFDLEGNPVTEITLERNLQAPGTEAFSLLDNQLYLVRERDRFCRIIL